MKGTLKYLLQQSSLHSNFNKKINEMKLNERMKLHIALKMHPRHITAIDISIQNCSYFGWRVVYTKPGLLRLCLHGHFGKQGGRLIGVRLHTAEHHPSQIVQLLKAPSHKLPRCLIRWRDLACDQREHSFILSLYFKGVSTLTCC